MYIHPLELSVKKTIRTDINQNIDKEYYKYLLKQHNYLCDYRYEKENYEDNIKMEHSYTRDWQPTDNAEVMTTRTILIEQPPQCPSCHLLPNHEEKIDTPDVYNVPMPPYNTEAGRLAMDETEQAIQSCLNSNADTIDWTENINKNMFTEQQLIFFNRIEHILDLDQLARLAIKDSPNECLRRRAIIEKSVARMRQALASVHWEARLTQWIHGLLLTYLSPKYMISYIDILQLLKLKVPTLVDKMLFGRPIDFNQTYLNAILKRPWEPTITSKSSTLPRQSIIIIVPSSPCPFVVGSRQQRWCDQLGTLTTAIPIQINLNQTMMKRQSIEQITDQIVAVSRAKIQEVRNEAPNRHIILVGFNAGAAIALQVALVEAVNSIICLGFAYNTMNGVRGAPDDRLLEITTPVLFVIGQNAQRSSQEEIESLRERMTAQTSLVVIGSADDSLRVKKLSRNVEGFNQSMIDNMIIDEIQEFATTCILNPPGPRQPNLNHLNGHEKYKTVQLASSNIISAPFPKKPRLSTIQSKNIRPRTNKTRKLHHLLETNSHAFEMAVNSILPSDLLPEIDDEMPMMEPLISTTDGSDVISTYEIITTENGHSCIQSLKPISNRVVQNIDSGLTQKVKFVPSNKFVHIKPPPLNTQKIYVKTPKSSATQSYTLPVMSMANVTTNNKLLTVKNKNAIQHQILSTTSYDKLNGNSFQPTVNLGQKISIVQPNAINNEQQISSIKLKDSDFLNGDFLDIPIVFADNDGNIEENIPSIIDTAIKISPADAQEIGNSENTIIQNPPRLINTLAPTNLLPIRNSSNNTSVNKFFVLNSGNNIKKYKKVIVPNVLQPQIIVSNPSKTNSIGNNAPVSIPTNNNNTLLPGTKIDISQLMKPNQSKTLNNNMQNPIIINVDSDKTTFKKVIKIHSNGKSQSNNSIVLKQSDLKDMQTIQSGIINQNITVRKINIVRSKANLINKPNKTMTIIDSSNMDIANTPSDPQTEDVVIQ